MYKIPCISLLQNSIWVTGKKYVTVNMLFPFHSYSVVPPPPLSPYQPRHTTASTTTYNPWAGQLITTTTLPEDTTREWYPFPPIYRRIQPLLQPTTLGPGVLNHYTTTTGPLSHTFTQPLLQPTIRGTNWRLRPLQHHQKIYTMGPP